MLSEVADRPSSRESPRMSERGDFSNCQNSERTHTLDALSVSLPFAPIDQLLCPRARPHVSVKNMFLAQSLLPPAANKVCLPPPIE